MTKPNNVAVFFIAPSPDHPEFVQQHQAEAERAGRAQTGREADDVVAMAALDGIVVGGGLGAGH
jgi:hypothetical protein